jgi:O-acetyl-ADP-ribose deacetylase (regulator of RNase III)
VIKIIKGDITKLAKDYDIVVHGCNCQNTMGSGVAKAIRDKWPEAYTADTVFSHQYINRPYLKLGQYSEAPVPGLLIVNAYTQYDYLPRGVDHFEYASFAVILQKLAHFYPNKDFLFPQIGAGLAGGHWPQILAMLEQFDSRFRDGSTTIVEFS